MNLTRVGQIKKGDKISCTYNGLSVHYVAKDILSPGEDNEEVIINKKKNKYFITAMAIDGSSWAKNVHIEDKT